MSFPRVVAALILVGMGVVTLAGCTSAPPAPAPTNDWSDRMNTLFDDPHGQGGASGDIKRGSKARSMVELLDLSRGKYDVLAVCTGTGIVHLAIKTLASSRSVLAAADIACGATLRLPVTVTTTGISVEASGTGPPAQWDAVIVTPGWQPDPTMFR